VQLRLPPHCTLRFYLSCERTGRLAARGSGDCRRGDPAEGASALVDVGVAAAGAAALAVAMAVARALFGWALW
jgi:hypothetical protein